MTDPGALEPLLEYLKTQRGFDFTGYKRSSLARRIARRMDAVGVDTYERYLDHLEVQSAEFALLFNTILINVTAFFRDPETWTYVAETVIPDILSALPEEGPVRVWCAGCASGEETYTVAMLLAEALGEEAFLRRVKIYATDVDDEALDAARLASYSADIVANVPPAMVERYFTRTDTRFAFRKDLRRTVIFGRNDLVQDAPISRIDLLVCRNTLMYFTAETQARILRRFNFALSPAGYLLMGKSEMLITHSDVFRPDDLKRRVFRKVPLSSVRDRLGSQAMSAPEADGDGSGSLTSGAFDAGSDAQLVVDRDGTVRLVNASARALLGISADGVGRPLKDLQASYTPVELRSHLDETWKTHREVTVDGIEFQRDGSRRLLDMRIVPLGNDGDASGAVVMLTDVTDNADLERRLLESKHALETSHEELQSTVEELETTNEELQSTNEELETTNEELQSTNEELETMNEELQSTNEELETINEELRERSRELDQVNAFLEAILTSLEVAVIVIDRGLVVRIWNEQSTELWGLRSEETIGEHLLGLDIGLPLEALRQSLRGATEAGEQATLTLEATNRRGRPVSCSVTILGLEESRGVAGAILLIEAQPAD